MPDQNNFSSGKNGHRTHSNLGLGPTFSVKDIISRTSKVLSANNKSKSNGAHSQDHITSYSPQFSGALGQNVRQKLEQVPAASFLGVKLTTKEVPSPPVGISRIVQETSSSTNVEPAPQNANTRRKSGNVKAIQVGDLSPTVAQAPSKPATSSQNSNYNLQGQGSPTVESAVNSANSANSAPVKPAVPATAHPPVHSPGQPAADPQAAPVAPSGSNTLATGNVAAAGSAGALANSGFSQWFGNNVPEQFSQLTPEQMYMMTEQNAERLLRFPGLAAFGQQPPAGQQPAGQQPAGQQPAGQQPANNPATPNTANLWMSGNAVMDPLSQMNQLGNQMLQMRVNQKVAEAMNPREAGIGKSLYC